MSSATRRSLAGILMVLWGLLSTGCGRDLETEYGKSRGTSINGSAVMAEMYRKRGDEVKTAHRLTDQVGEWADLIVRFAKRPGLPDQREADWYSEWFAQGIGRTLVYVVRDFDAEDEYWDEVLRELGSEAEESARKKIEAKRDAAREWLSNLPEKVKTPADARVWFRTGRAIEPPRPCKKLGGPWAAGLDVRQAAISIHEPFVAGEEDVLLTGDGQPLAVAWEVDDDGRVLAIANGSFLLNEPLVNPARRKLALRVLEWSSPADKVRHVAFVEGDDVTAESSGPPTIWDLLGRVSSFRWVAIQMGVLGLAACLARAPRLGRARPEPMGRIDRPVAHAEALGGLLSRATTNNLSAEALENYRAWRKGRSTPS